MPGSGKIRVLIVDDSAFMRKVLHSIIDSDPQMEVAGEAKDGKEAVTLANSLKPHVISMDIMMPHVDGLQATEQIMARAPKPIVIVSSETKEGAAVTLRALELGAIDFVPKPTSGVDLDMESVRDELIRKLKMAARVRVVRSIKSAPAGSNGDQARAAAGDGASAPPSAAAVAAAKAGRFPVVMVASSTGGPQTLMSFVPMFPANFMGAVVLIQHMPGTFTSQFSAQLGEVAKIRVKEAENNEPLQTGVFYVCPGAQHLRINGGGRITLDSSDRINGYRPCADVAFETAAAYAGPMTIGVVLTGMGSDAARGTQAVKAAGGHVIVQDEVTSVIFGMPAEAIKTGAVDQVLGIDAIQPAIEKRVLYLMGAARVGAM